MLKHMFSLYWPRSQYLSISVGFIHIMWSSSLFSPLVVQYDIFICIYLFIHPLVNGQLMNFQLGVVANSAARNMLTYPLGGWYISDLQWNCQVTEKVRDQLLSLMPEFSQSDCARLLSHLWNMKVLVVSHSLSVLVISFFFSSWAIQIYSTPHCAFILYYFSCWIMRVSTLLYG